MLTTTEGQVRHRATQARPVRNVLLNWASFALGTAISFVLTPFVVHTLGNTEYGIWALLASLTGHMGLLDLGVRSAVLRYVARHHARSEDAEASRTVSAGLAIFGITGVLAVAAAVVIAVLIDRLFNIPAALVGTARLVMLASGLTIAVSIVSSVFDGAVVALQRWDLRAIASMAITVARAIGIVGVLAAGGGILGLALIGLGSSLLFGAVMYVTTRKVYPQLAIRIRGVERDTIKKILSFSVFSTLIYVSTELIFSADSVVIGAFLPVAMITYFAIGAAFTGYVRGMILAISSTITPRASALQGIGATDELEHVLVRATSLATLVALPVTITLLLRGPTFIGLWMGPSYASLSGRILIILTIALSFSVARQVVLSAMMGMNRHRSLAAFYVVEGLLNLGLSVYWIHSMGIVGVALGTAVPNVVVTLLAIPWLVRDALGTRLGRFWAAVWLRPLAAMIPFAAATYAIERMWTARGLLTYFAGVGAAIPAAALGAWFIGLPTSDRRAFAASLRGWLTTTFSHT